MRVLLIANTLPPSDISGVGEQVLQLASGLRSEGHEVEILGRGVGGARGPKILFPLAIMPAVLAACRRFRPHLVQVHESDGAFGLLLLSVLRPFMEPGPRLIALLQVSYVQEWRAVRAVRDRGRVIGRPGAQEWAFKWLKAPLQVALGWMTGWLADRVLAPSEQTAFEIGRDYSVDDVGVLPNVTTDEERSPCGKSAAQAKGRLLFVGRLRVRKGVEVLLYAMRQLKDRGRTKKLMVVGAGEHLPRTQRLSAALGLNEEVEFLGRRSGDEVLGLMRGAEVLVVPSTYEGMPLVILEAMASGLPVVASAVSGIPEVLGPDQRGWLVPPEDSEALAQTLESMLDRPELRLERSNEARAWVVEHANPRRAAELWLGLVGGTTEPRRQEKFELCDEE